MDVASSVTRTVKSVPVDEHGTAFLVVMHNPELAARCQRVVELVDGQIVRDSRVAARALTQRATEEDRVRSRR